LLLTKPLDALCDQLIRSDLIANGQVRLGENGRGKGMWSFSPQPMQERLQSGEGSFGIARLQVLLCQESPGLADRGHLAALLGDRYALREVVHSLLGPPFQEREVGEVE
jgi:hypothetical protein